MSRRALTEALEILYPLMFQGDNVIGSIDVITDGGRVHMICVPNKTQVYLHTRDHGRLVLTQHEIEKIITSPCDKSI